MRIHITPVHFGKNKLLAIGAIFIVSLLGIFNHVGAAPNDPQHNGRLITIHDRGEERVILTEAQTVGDALKDAHIAVVSEDSIEPSVDETFVASNYTVNIYRARPVIVVDGIIREKIMTAAQSPGAIAKAANLELKDEDRAKLSPSRDIVSDGASVVLTIDRAAQFTLSLYGTEKTTYSHAQTVGEMLDSKKIKLEKSDTLSVDRNSKLIAGMKVSIWRNGVQTATIEEPIAFPTRKILDTDRPVGYHEIKRVGVKGRQSVTYQITVKNGKEVSRKAIQTVVLERPKEQVEVAGAAMPPGSHVDWMVAAGISPSEYGYVDFIFTRESHWNPAARNPSGLYVGLGQTSPSRLSAACPNWQSDPVCQIRFFNRYATSRYGGWAGSYNFWKSHNWW